MATSYIKTENRGSVKVTANGAKTFATLLEDLWTLADTSKISRLTKLRIGNNYYNASMLFSNAIRLGSVTLSGGDIECGTVSLGSSYFNYLIAKISSNNTVTYNNNSSTVAASGTEFELYY